MTEVYSSGGVWPRVEGHSVVLNNTSADSFLMIEWSDNQGAAAYLIW
jgi:hypothetical protein